MTITGGGGTADRGGGILNLAKTNLTLTNCTVSGNTASTNGGGLANYGAATLTNCTVSGNKAVAGGGLFSAGGTLLVTNSKITGSTTGIQVQNGATRHDLRRRGHRQHHEHPVRCQRIRRLHGNSLEGRPLRRYHRC